jgi:hypothetical protein
LQNLKLEIPTPSYLTFFLGFLGAEAPLWTERDPNSSKASPGAALPWGRPGLGGQVRCFFLFKKKMFAEQFKKKHTRREKGPRATGQGGLSGPCPWLVTGPQSRPCGQPCHRAVHRAGPVVATETEKLGQCGAKCGTMYCDRQCQKLDWKRPKPLCEQVKTRKEASSGSTLAFKDVGVGTRIIGRF